MYNGKYFYGQGRDFLWTDALADLQNKLSDGIILKCCLACKHGNLCPVGNRENQVFCMKDIIPKQKSDLFFYTEDETERKNRSRTSFECCNTFEQQSEAYYTYNDFVYFLKNNHNRPI